MTFGPLLGIENKYKQLVLINQILFTQKKVETLKVISEKCRKGVTIFLYLLGSKL